MDISVYKYTLDEKQISRQFLQILHKLSSNLAIFGQTTFRANLKSPWESHVLDSNGSPRWDFHHEYFAVPNTLLNIDNQTMLIFSSWFWNIPNGQPKTSPKTCKNILKPQSWSCSVTSLMFATLKGAEKLRPWQHWPLPPLDVGPAASLPIGALVPAFLVIPVLVVDGLPYCSVNLERKSYLNPTHNQGPGLGWPYMNPIVSSFWNKWSWRQLGEAQTTVF